MHLSKCGTLARFCKILHSFCTDSLLLFQLTLIAIRSSALSVVLLSESYGEESGLVENEKTAPLPPLWHIRVVSEIYAIEIR